MDAFVSRKRRRIASSADEEQTSTISTATESAAILDRTHVEEDSTDIKLAIVSSLHSDRSPEDLLELLLDCNGSVEAVLGILALCGPPDQEADQKVSQRRKSSAIGMQSSLRFSPTKQTSNGSGSASKLLTKKGKTLHLFTPEDIAKYTPCSIVHNFLPSNVANDLLKEVLPETKSYESITFKLFDNVVKSPHTACFYVDSLAERQRQKREFLYNGSNLDDIREILPVMRQVSHLVRQAVNQEIETRIRDFYPGGKKLRYQTPQEWQPNAAFVNCYDGGAQAVGYHSDQLTYLGPRAVIGSLSLGVAREFRVRRIVAKEEDDNGEAADASGQIAIHLPHNSLLVMHAEMQEEWKHSIAPAQAIDPHPLAGNKRINITYRWYREEFNPQYTPRCKCDVPTVLKTVQKQKQNRGRYMWMCQVAGRPGEGSGCGYFEWADFTDDGDPIWKHRPKKQISQTGSYSKV